MLTQLETPATLIGENPDTVNGFNHYEELNSTPAVSVHDPESAPKKLHFLEATNTKLVELDHLKKDCIVPVFAKDNELTISHPAFIEAVYGAAQMLFQNETIDLPEIMVSHNIMGRVPEAIHKPQRELVESDITMYYERMAFSFEIPSFYADIAGNRLNLTVTGVRAYNHENLFTKKSMEKFSVAIGFRNQVCCNLCTFTDGYKSDLRTTTVQDLQKQVLNLFSQYNAEKHLEIMREFSSREMSEHQFAQFLGKTRLYQCLPASEKRLLPPMEMTDSQINAVAKNYYTDKNFRRTQDTGRITLWCVYNLLTGANKNSYIDNYLDRSANATQLTIGLNKALAGDPEHKWFIE